MFPYRDYKELNSQEAFNYLIETLNITNRTPNYFVDWEKVYRNTHEFELYLHTLNYLIGKENIYVEALNLFTKQPHLLSVIPTLIAVREKEFPILYFDENKKMVFNHLNFNIREGTVLSQSEVEVYIDFINDAGLLTFLEKRLTNNLVDYVFGVEVGLDSNGRKNRSGTSMEGFVEETIKEVCLKKNYHYMVQATAPLIESKWGYKVPTDKLTRRFDFAINNNVDNQLYLIEVNYYGGGGSKLKSVAGEFTDLQRKISTESKDVTFIWITDGQGWHTAKAPLQDAYNKISHVLNLRMLDDKYLEYIIK